MAAEKIPITTTITFLMEHHYENMQTVSSIAFLYLCTRGKIVQIVKAGKKTKNITEQKELRRNS